MEENLGTMENITNETNTSQEFVTGSGFNRTISSIYATIAFIMILGIWFGNLLVLVAIVTKPRLRNTTNILVFSLSLCDMLSGVVFFQCTFVSFIYSRGSEEVKPLCLSCLGLMALTLTISLETLLGIAIERYIKIVHALSYSQIITNFRVVVAITIIWTFNIIFHCSTFIWNNYDSNKRCHIIDIQTVVYLVVAMTILVVAMVIINVLYSRIFLIAWKQRKNIISMERSMGVSSGTAKDNKLTKTMALVNGLLYVCWAPFVTLTFIQLALDKETLNTEWLGHLYYNFTHILVANSLVNPIIYAVRNRDFKDAFKKLLRCSDGGNKVMNLSTETELSVTIRK